MPQQKPSSDAAVLTHRGFRAPASDARRGLGRTALFVLLLVMFLVNIAHGVLLGQDRILFSPLYRLRQSLAIALSEMHHPPARGYAAYGSVVDVLNQNGFTVFDNEPGKHLDLTGLIGLLDNGRELNRILKEALHVPIDPKLGVQIIRGNEPAFADYIYLAFKLFGVRVSSLYYFYYLLLGVSCALYVGAFRREAFLMYVLAIYLAGQFFLQNYVHSKGLELNTIFNSRLFSALSLVPAAHVMFAQWQQQPLSRRNVLSVGVQAALLVFIVSCRLEAMWQVMMILAAGVALGVYALVAAQPAHRWRDFARGCTRLWPAGLLALLLVANTARIDMSANPLYKTEPKTHAIWHEVLMGILSSSDALQREYLGHVEDPYSDTMVYEAVINDLNRRHDTTSPGVVVVNGQSTFDLMSGWSYYERMARSLTFRIVLRHPLLVAEGLVQKAQDQMDWYATRKALSFKNFRVFLLIAIAAAIACAAAGDMVADRRRLRQGIIVTAFFIAFSCITPAIEPSALAVSTLLCFIATIVIGLSYAAGAAVQGLQAIRPAGLLSRPPTDR